MNVYQATQNTRHCPNHPVERSGSHGLNYKLECSSTWDTLTAGFFCGTGTNLYISKGNKPSSVLVPSMHAGLKHGQSENLPALDVTILRLNINIIIISYQGQINGMLYLSFGILFWLKQ